MRQEQALEVQGLCVGYGKKTILRDINFVIPQGTLTCILGPNGAGKSSLLKASVGLVPSMSGTISFLSQPYSVQRQKIAYVPQRNAVDWDFPVSVFDVVSMGCFGRRGLFGRLSKCDRELVEWGCQQVGLDSLMDRQIRELSGGQQQKVFIARALVGKPDIYLMDEPFAGVDMATEKSIVALLKQMQKEGKTIIMVHHDLCSVRQYFDWAVLLNESVIGFGPVSTVLCRDNLRKAYGGLFSFLDEESL